MSFFLFMVLYIQGKNRSDEKDLMNDVPSLMMMLVSESETTFWFCFCSSMVFFLTPNIHTQVQRKENVIKTSCCAVAVVCLFVCYQALCYVYESKGVVLLTFKVKHDGVNLKYENS
jgi:hypothetical protein